MHKSFPRLFFLFFGILDAAALTAAFLLSLKVIVIFFSYFTVLSNIAISSLFLYFGFSGIKKNSKTLDWIYGAAVLYMTITGIIYWSILVNAHSLALDPWVNLTLHGFMPIAAFLSWVLFPSGKKLEYRVVLQWLVFPLIFSAYTLIRGPFVNWYPYPFLNPVAPGSYFKVFMNIVMLLSFMGFVGCVLIWLGNRLGKRKISMSRKTLVMIGMVVGSLIGGYVPVLFGADFLSFSSIIGNAAGGLAGIWVAYKFTQGF